MIITGVPFIIFFCFTKIRVIYAVLWCGEFSEDSKSKGTAVCSTGGPILSAKFGLGAHLLWDREWILILPQSLALDPEAASCQVTVVWAVDFLMTITWKEMTSLRGKKGRGTEKKERYQQTWRASYILLNQAIYRREMQSESHMWVTNVIFNFLVAIFLKKNYIHLLSIIHFI